MSKLVTIARVSTLEETLVIASLLESSDMHCTVADRHVGVVHWGYQIALGGFRLMVPASDAAMAREIVIDAASNANVQLGERRGRRLSERIKPGAAFATNWFLMLFADFFFTPSLANFWVVPVLAAGAWAWWNAPGREFIPPDDITELP